MKNSLSTIAAVCVSLLAVFLSCTGEAPEIRQIFWQLNVTYDPTTDATGEYLSLFLHVADSDGIEDIDLLYIIQDEHELLWELSPDGWERLEENEELWIGSNKVEMSDSRHGSVFPRDLYRIIVVDKSGERARDEIYINADTIDFETLNFPTSRVEEDLIIIDGENPEYIVWFYDLEDNQIKLFATQEREIGITRVLNARELQIAKRYYIYSFDSTRGYGLIYGPIDLP